MRFSEITFIPKRPCSHSVTVAIAALSREGFGGRVTVMSINKTTLALGTGGYALNPFSSLVESAL